MGPVGISRHPLLPFKPVNPFNVSGQRQLYICIYTVTETVVHCTVVHMKDKPFSPYLMYIMGGLLQGRNVQR